ncbi:MULTISPECIES: glycosyltransferase family 8 protein [Eubacteriales]|uniref:glycosyltransferase family 8 protein n=1 Tax=Eubacteriales TaxID=186802 RepID=UPI00181E4D93|nr:glycosyltransferase family 8 protein [Caproiciproducens sp. MSJ-32]MBU5455567.1 glycosyltransferase family 8 protein [Caproiciproducens sp. MSJ-32]NLZ33500.1 glycosyltransferase family 8 protein [Clostridiales bacterium]
MRNNNDYIHLLFTADEKYAGRIPVVLQSLYINDSNNLFHIHLIYDSISEELIYKLENFCKKLGYYFSAYRIREKYFSNAPVNKHYSEMMYYRLLAADILPKSIDRVIYLDPDILLINSIEPLWKMDLEGKIFAAASHTEEKRILDNINKLRLGISSAYFNTGVLLMDLTKCRTEIVLDEIISFIEKNGNRLLLPDQDVFNALYSKFVKLIPDEIWNYDVRKYTQYYIKSSGMIDENWIIQNTVILHYCGKDKPWNKQYKYRFADLYRHYQQLCKRKGYSI